MGKQQLQTLLHLSSGFVRKRHRKDLGGISTMLPNQVGNAMGECPCFSASRTSHHQQRSFMVIHSTALSIVEAGEKTHTA